MSLTRSSHRAGHSHPPSHRVPGGKLAAPPADGVHDARHDPPPPLLEHRFDSTHINIQWHRVYQRGSLDHWLATGWARRPGTGGKPLLWKSGISDTPGDTHTQQPTHTNRLVTTVYPLPHSGIALTPATTRRTLDNLVGIVHPLVRRQMALLVQRGQLRVHARCDNTRKTLVTRPTTAEETPAKPTRLALQDHAP